MTQKNIIISVIVAVVIVAGGFLYVFTLPSVQQTPQTSLPVQTTPATQPATNKPTTLTKLPTVKSPTAPLVKSSIVSVAMSDVINASGLAVGSKSVFAPTTKDIYAVLTLRNAIRTTQLSYTRYFNGKYVDSKVSHPSKDGVKNFHFQWTLKAGQTRKIGTYRLVFYINGAKSKEVSYTIK